MAKQRRRGFAGIQRQAVIIRSSKEPSHKTKRRLLTERLAESKLERTMSSYYDYLENKMAPKPAYERAMPKVVKRPQPPSPEIPMTVEESTACEAIIERVKAYWRR